MVIRIDGRDAGQEWTMDDGQGVGGQGPGVGDENFPVDLRFTLHEIRITVFFDLDFCRSWSYLKDVETEPSI